MVDQAINLQINTGTVLKNRPILIIFLLFPSSAFGWTAAKLSMRVADSDTITVTRNHEKVRVRHYEINTPESDQWHGHYAMPFTSVQGMGKTVQAQEFDLDRFGGVAVRTGQMSVHSDLLKLFDTLKQWEVQNDSHPR